MAAPKVFVSSTYYDLKPVRANIRNFIESLGYEPIMHERAEVAYTQDKTLEESCYNAVEGADIVVCIIGDRFGTQSTESHLSITMKEVETAIKRKKKVYIFIASEIYAENRTYEVNKDTGVFKSAFVNNLKIHEFISHLSSNVRNHPIVPFDSIDDIIFNLKTQFAGLFQSLLLQDASMTEAKTAYDLQYSVDYMKKILEDFEQQKEEFFNRFRCTHLITYLTLTRLKQHLGLENATISASDFNSVKEILILAGYSVILENNETRMYSFGKCVEVKGKKIRKEITLLAGLFDDDLTLRPLRKMEDVDANLKFNEVEEDIDEELPF